MLLAESTRLLSLHNTPTGHNRKRRSARVCKPGMNTVTFRKAEVRELLNSICIEVMARRSELPSNVAARKVRSFWPVL